MTLLQMHNFLVFHFEFEFYGSLNNMVFTIFLAYYASVITPSKILQLHISSWIPPSYISIILQTPSISDTNILLIFPCSSPIKCAAWSSATISLIFIHPSSLHTYYVHPSFLFSCLMLPLFSFHFIPQGLPLLKQTYHIFILCSAMTTFFTLTLVSPLPHSHQCKNYPMPPVHFF